MARALVAALAALAPALAPAAPPRAAAQGAYVSCRDRSDAAQTARRGAARRHEARPALSGEEGREELEESVRRWEAEAKAFRAEVHELVQKQFEERRRFLADNYEQAIRDLEGLERGERDAAILRFEEFLSRYPDDPRFSADAMLRLAELYYEKANDDFDLALKAHNAAAREALAEGREPPSEPVKSYARPIALYQQLITGFPRYRFLHAVTYLLAYCLGEMGQGEEAQRAYRALIEKYPQSPYVPEAWVRLGDWHFDEVKADSLAKAAQSFSRMYDYPSHPLYARAIYKLGWTYYRMDRFEQAVEAFTRLLDHYVAVARKGEKPGGDVWPEAIQYAAVSFAGAGPGGVDRAKAFFAAKGGRRYEAEVFARLGDAYLEETRYALAVDAYREVLARDRLSPEAPRIQAKIVLAWSRARQLDREAAERERLVATYSEGTVWWERNRRDPDVAASVRELVERSLLRAASFHHAQAQTHEREGRVDAAVAEYRVAARAYGDYLARYPHSRQAYELSYAYADCLYAAREFDAAARVYEAVRDDPSGERLEAEAALSAVIAWEGEVARLQRTSALEERKVLRSTDRKEKEAVRAEPIPYVYGHLVRDSDVLLARYPQHPRAAAIAYKAGEVFFRYGDLDEARCRFEEVVSRWPEADVARFAANLLIESHLTTRDWAAVEQASARLQGQEVARDPALRAALQKFKLGGRFQRAMQLMEQKAWEDAARLFLALVAEEPRHEFADKALYNAASCHEGARRFESALRLYERISREYPESALADEALFRVGWNAENTYELEKAVEHYLALVKRYPGSKHRKDALYDAARALENLQRYDEAAAAFAAYARAYPDAEDAARTLFHAAVVHEKKKEWRREIEALQDFVRRFSRSKELELVVQAHLKIALAHRELGDEKGARAGYQAAIAAFAARGLDPDASPRAAAAAAEARFRLAEFEFDRYDRIALPATTDAKKLKKALEAKLAEAKKVAPLYDEVMRYRRPDWILAAFYRKAFLLERLAQTIYEAPPPPEYRKKGMEEYLAAYQDGLSQFAQPFEDQAVGVYVQAIEAARKLHVKNEWTKKIAESLARYRPKEYPVLKEAKARLLTMDLSPAWAGAGGASAVAMGGGAAAVPATPTPTEPVTSTPVHPEPFDRLRAGSADTAEAEARSRRAPTATPTPTATPAAPPTAAATTTQPTPSLPTPAAEPPPATARPAIESTTATAPEAAPAEDTRSQESAAARSVRTARERKAKAANDKKEGQER